MDIFYKLNAMISIIERASNYATTEDCNASMEVVKDYFENNCEKLTIEQVNEINSRVESAEDLIKVRDNSDEEE